MKSNPIHDYILKSKSNLSVASAIETEWPEARAKLVSAFLGRLGARLKKKLKGWDGGPWESRFFLDQWAGFSVEKPAWKQRAIALQCIRFGDGMQMGVCRATKDTGKLPLHEPLLLAVRQVFPSATSSSWWEACVTMHSPAPDWRKPEVLWRIHKDPAFLIDVANQLLEIAEVTAPIIDGLAKKRAKNR